MKKKSTGTAAAKPKPSSSAKARPKARGPRAKDSRPVLTSPWKIGVLVSLLLVLSGLGVGAYFAVLHRIEFPWLAISRGGIRIDSLGFFRQMYPLVAGLVLVALVSYFLVASSVRRYKFYLDSGQDYRKMISLAESVDDLTNPAQIARLSSYPELQSVLRSYGDQIREISQDISRDEAATGYGDLETDVEALIGGADAAGSALEAKPYAAVLRRISDLRSSHRAQIDELEKRDEADRRALGEAVLSCGRIVEAVSSAREELLGITKATGELAHAARGLAAGRGALAQGDAKSAAGEAGSLESSVRTLEEGGRVLQELSEENNGIAIGLALMAARGTFEQHDLAAFAERVRLTAERFQKLSGSVAAIARELMAAGQGTKGAPGAAAPAAPAAQARLMQTIHEIASAIEERCGRLDGRMQALSGEAREVRGLLRRDTTGDEVLGGPAPERMEDIDDVAPRAEAGELSIDRGSTWGGMMETEEAAADAPEAEAEPEPETNAPAAAAEEPPAGEGPAEAPAAEMGDFSDMSSLRNLDASAMEPGGQPAPRGGDGGWMEMPGHSWRPVTVESAGDGAVDEAERIPVDVRASGEATPAADAAEQDDDPVHDLTDLGAVEYVEETQTQR